MCELNLEEACNAVGEFNQNPINLATDYLTQSQFIPPLAAERVPAMVVVIDRLWATQLFWDDNAQEIISGSLQNNWDDIQRALYDLVLLPPLHENPNYQEIAGIAERLFHYILEPDGDNAIHQHFVFTTKFFHWCAPRHFPITDNRAMNAINQIQDNVSLQLNVGSYPDWISLYHNLFAQNANILDQIRQCDEDTQGDSPFHIENTLLRILDKYFYIRG